MPPAKEIIRRILVSMLIGLLIGVAVGLHFHLKHKVAAFRAGPLGRTLPELSTTP